MSFYDFLVPEHRSIGDINMDADRKLFPHQGQIKDGPVGGYEREPAHEMRLATIMSKPGETWANPQNPASSYSDVHRAAFRLPYSSPTSQSTSNGNTFHIPPFRVLAETASAGEYRPSSSPQVPTIPPRYEYLPQNPIWLAQHNLPHLSYQGNAYAHDDGHAHPADMPAPRVGPPTVNPRKLQHRQSPEPDVRAESFSESEDEVDIGGESNRGRGHRFDKNDADGWRDHPDTIRMGTPEFGNTKITGDMRDAAGTQVPVDIHARMVLKREAARQRFCWILYRRNYFGIQGSYRLKPLEDSCPDETLYLYRRNCKPERIQALFMCMRGVVETEEGPEIKIVVFNAKRKPLHEGKDPPPIDPQRMKPLTEGSTKFFTKSTGDRQDHMNVPMNHTFHRNQFRAATQNNGARRTEQQFYHILLELKAEVIVDGVPKLFTVASKMSESLVVRGRCPLSFKDKDGDGGHIGGPDHSRRKPPRTGGGHGVGGGSTKRRQKEGPAKATGRGARNETGGRRPTRASSRLPSLTYATRSRNTDTTSGSPQSGFGGNGTVTRDTIPCLDRKLLTFSRGGWEEDEPWGRAGAFS